MIAEPARAGAHDVLALQRAVGNRAVRALLRAADDSPDRAVVQRRISPSVIARSTDASPEAIHEAAGRGLLTPATRIPYADRIQRAFGRHAIIDAPAHVGDAATASATAMNAAAYTSRGHVVFAGTPDLRTAAHEAAHIVQQAAGVHVPWGVGRAGDSYEAHADAVAERVVAGQSAEAMLDHVAPRATSSGRASVAEGAVQRKILRSVLSHTTRRKESIDPSELDAVVERVFQLNTRGARAIKNNSDRRRVREILTRLYANDQAYEDADQLVDAINDRLALGVQLQAIDFSRPDLAQNHPEREDFKQAVEDTTNLDPDAAWDTVMSGVSEQEQLNLDNRKHAGNEHYAKVARQFSSHLAVPQRRRAALWSGGFDASLYAQHQGYVTLEATPAGRLFDQLKLHHDFSVLGPLWNQLSTKFVESFQGEVHVFMRTLDSESVLFRQEIEAVMGLAEKGVVREIHWHVLKNVGPALVEVGEGGEPLDAKSDWDGFANFRLAAEVMDRERGRLKGPNETARTMRLKLQRQARSIDEHLESLAKHMVRWAGDNDLFGLDHDDGFKISYEEALKIIDKKAPLHDIWHHITLQLGNATLREKPIEALVEEMEDYIQKQYEEIAKPRDLVFF